MPLPAVALDHVELVRVAMPLVRPFRTSFGTQTARDVLLVHVRDADGTDGWGECATTAAPVYDADFTDGAALVLADHLVPAVLAAGTARGVDDVRARLAGYRGHHAARAALEAAVWDLQLRAAGRSLADHLGVARDRVPAGVSVGIPTDPDGAADVDALVAQVGGYLEESYLRVKVKIEPGFDLAAVRGLRAAFGSDLRLQVDANTAYSPDDPAHIAVLDELDSTGLEMIEQPFGADRLRSHAEHAARWRTPVCLDESITDRSRATDAVDDGACAIVNIKIGRVGGLTEAIAVHDRCRARSVPVWCGGMLETGIGRGVNVALAGLPGFTLPGDTSASSRYFAEDLTEPFLLEDGHVAIPRTAGASPPPDPGRLAAWTTDRTSLR
ncbi:MAG: o-succinylbenzoate synthase [Nitriliruptor sp.]|uniref:o-succinylbenzoate synthase n=1 Tax=Nitriliruptor sp. TaxID=2448056 RepID=UPI00349FD499